VDKIIQILEKTATDGIPEVQENEILVHETQQMLVHYYSLQNAVQKQALQAYFNQSWLGEVAVYNDKLSRVPKEQVKKIISAGLKKLKISIAGPNKF
jgi:hypothetical protein